MYGNQLVAAIKVSGKVVREFKDTVYLPFGSEYSIYLKNLDPSRRAIVNVYIDGKCVTDNGLVVEHGKPCNLKRAIDGNLKKGNKFKFIERDGKVEEHRGIEAEDGLVRIEYAFEKKLLITDDIYVPYRRERRWYDRPFYYDNWPYTTIGGCVRDTTSTGDSIHHAFTSQVSNAVGEQKAFDAADVEAVSASVKTKSTKSRKGPQLSAPQPQNETGITVKGSKSKQKFTEVASFITGDTHVLVIRILGQTEDNEEVRTVVNTKTKIECENCGTKNKATSKFCSHCGTSVHAFA